MGLRDDHTSENPCVSMCIRAYICTAVYTCAHLYIPMHTYAHLCMSAHPLAGLASRAVQDKDSPPDSESENKSVA